VSQRVYWQPLGTPSSGAPAAAYNTPLDSWDFADDEQLLACGLGAGAGVARAGSSSGSWRSVAGSLPPPVNTPTVEEDEPLYGLEDGLDGDDEPLLFSPWALRRQQLDRLPSVDLTSAGPSAVSHLDKVGSDWAGGPGMSAFNMSALYMSGRRVREL
jgi:hypothetical protein